MRVPVRSTAQIQTTQARATTQANPDMFGAAVARGAQGLAQGIDVAAQRWEQMEDERAESNVRLRLSEYNSTVREILQGENGYLTQQGENAIDGYDPTAEQLERARQEILGNLSPRERDMFDPASARRLDVALNSAASHQARQRIVLRSASFDAIEASQLDTAVSMWPDAPGFEAEVINGIGHIEHRAEIEGWDDAMLRQRKREFRAQAASVAISAALDSGNIERAQALREQYDGDFNADQRSTIVGQLEGERRLVRQQEAVDDVMRRFGTDTNAAFAYIYENFSGSDEVSIAAEYQRRASRVQVEQGASQAAVFDEIAAGFESGQYEAISDVPIRMLEAVGARGEALLERRFIQGHSDFGDRVDTNFVGYLEHLANNDRARLAEMNPLDFREHVTSQEEYDQLFEWWGAALDSSRETPDLPSFFSDNQALTLRLEADGIDPASEEGLAIIERVQREVRVAMAGRDGEMPDTERDEIINRVIGSAITTTSPSFFGDRRRTTSVALADLGDAFADVPAAHRDAITNVFEGSEINPSEVRPMYDDAMADLMAPDAEGFAPDPTSPLFAAALTEELRDRREAVQIALERAEREEQQRRDAEAAAAAAAGDEEVSPVTVFDAPEPGSFGSPEWLRGVVGAEGIDGNAAVRGMGSAAVRALGLDGQREQREAQMRVQLARLGYPPESIERYMTNEFYRSAARRVIRDNIRYSGDQ